MDGVIVIDKPSGLTSHAVVAIARRALGERRIGHCGTLDPMATGVLALACGRATRLASLLAAHHKRYMAEILFGVCTDSYDITGLETSRSERVPGRDEVVAALDSLRGEYRQAPPPISAKKIQGQRAYALARAGTPVQPMPVPVRVPALEILGYDRSVATIELTCSAGFYVRALAHEAGRLVGTGACLQSLRRLASGDFTLAEAVTLEQLQEEPESVWAYVIPLARLLPELPQATLSAEGVVRASHGRDIGPDQVVGSWPLGDRGAPEPWVRLFDPEGALLALATPGHNPTVLHPAVVLS